MTFGDKSIYSDTLHWSDILLNSELVTELDLISDFDINTRFKVVFIFAYNILSHLGLAFVLMLTTFSSLLVMFPDFEFQTSLGT